jgi:hypothetical protein
MVQVEKDKKFERGFTGSTGKYLEVAARGGVFQQISLKKA